MGPITSLGLLVPVCLPILCRLWERGRRWDRCLCSLPSDWAGWQGVAYAARRQLYQETAGHGGGELIWGGERRSLAQMDHWNLTPIKSTGCKEGAWWQGWHLMLTLLDTQLGCWTSNKVRGLLVPVWWYWWIWIRKKLPEVIKLKTFHKPTSLTVYKRSIWTRMLTEAWKSLPILKNESVPNINTSFVSSRLRETTAVHGFTM